MLFRSTDDAIYNQPIPEFENLEQKLNFQSKNIDYNETMGKIVGQHQGAHYFTNGQRKGLNVGGTKEGLFVLQTNVTTNTIYTGQGANHSGLFKKTLFVKNDEVHFIRQDLALKFGETMQVMARIRYRQPLQQASLHQFDDGLYVDFQEPQSAITEGQFVAFYIDDELVGSGIIS